MKDFLRNFRSAWTPRQASPATRCASAGTLVLWSGLFLATQALAQDGLDKSEQRLREAIEKREKAKASLDSNRKYLDENRERIGTIRTDLQRLAQERASLNQELIEAGEKAKETEAKMTATEERLGKLETQETTLRGSLREQHASISRLLSAIQRMGRNPPPVMITRRSDALTMVRSAMMLARAFPKLRGDALALAGKLKRLVALMSGIREENERLRVEAKTLNEVQTKLASLLEAKRQSLGNRKVELAEVRRTVKIIGRNVNGLEELIGKLGPAIERETKIGREIQAAARRKAVEEAEAEARARRTAQADKLEELQLALNAPKPPAAPGTNSVQPTGIKPPSATALKPAFNLTPDGGAYVGDSARLEPAIPFHRAKGRLPLPAAGRIERDFGVSSGYSGRAKGITIKTRYGAQITSPADGWIVYAGKFRTYGQLLIIKAGHGYHILLAGLSRIDVQSGQFVLASEPVGTMKKAPGRRAGKDSPRLYVEFRKNGRPINPRPWWSASSKQKVQG